MIIQKVNKKKMFLNAAALILILGAIGYLILTNFVNFGKDADGKKIVFTLSEKPVKIKKTYSNLKFFDDSFFKSDVFEDLTEIKMPINKKLEFGKRNPFVKE